MKMIIFLSLISIVLPMVFGAAHDHVGDTVVFKCVKGYFAITVDDDGQVNAKRIVGNGTLYQRWTITDHPDFDDPDVLEFKNAEVPLNQLSGWSRVIGVSPRPFTLNFIGTYKPTNVQVHQIRIRKRWCLEMAGGDAPLQIDECDNTIPHQLWQVVKLNSDTGRFM